MQLLTPPDVLSQMLLSLLALYELSILFVKKEKETMHDIKWIRGIPRTFDEALERRGLSPQAKDLLDLDQKHRACLTEAQDLQAASQ